MQPGPSYTLPAAPSLPGPHVPHVCSWSHSPVWAKLSRGAPRASRQPHLHTGPQTNCLQRKSSSCSAGSGNGTKTGGENSFRTACRWLSFPPLQQRVGAGAGTSRLHSDGDGHLPSLGPLSITGRREVWRVYLCLWAVCAHVDAGMGLRTCESWLCYFWKCICERVSAAVWVCLEVKGIWHWTNSLTSLCLSFSIWNRGTVVVSTPYCKG